MEKPAEGQKLGKVLVVDDDGEVLQAIKGLLEANGFEVKALGSGKVAQQVAGVETFSVVLTDIRMPDLNGIALLHYIKKNTPIPVILMTGFSELSETKEAFEIGADDFIAKPFKKEELIAKVSKFAAQTKSHQEENVSRDEDYCKVSIEDFISGREIQVDIFIRLSSEKYVKIAHQGEDIPVERIKSYKEKNIKFLYMDKRDFKKYVGFNVGLAKVISKVDKISKEKKLNFLKHTGEMILENLYSNQLEETAFDNGKLVVESTLDLLTDDKDMFNLLSLLNSHTDFLYAHSLGVSVYSSMIARQLSWRSPVTLFKVSVGGLLHDIGKKEIDKGIVQKNRQKLTPEEIKTLESHPMRGMEILAAMPSVSGDIIQIVQQHHENCIGQGYPLGLKKAKIHPLARVVSAANEFCNLILKGPDGGGMSIPEAAKRFKTSYAETMDPEVVTALMKVVRMD